MTGIAKAQQIRNGINRNGCLNQQVSAFAYSAVHDIFLRCHMVKLPELLDKIRYADAADIGKLLIADFIFGYVTTNS